MRFIEYISYTASFLLLRGGYHAHRTPKYIGDKYLSFFFFITEIFQVPPPSAPRIYFRRDSGDEIIFSSQLYENYFLTRIAIHFNDFVVSLSLSLVNITPT